MPHRPLRDAPGYALDGDPAAGELGILGPAGDVVATLRIGRFNVWYAHIGGDTRLAVDDPDDAAVRAVRHHAYLAGLPVPGDTPAPYDHPLTAHRAVRSLDDVYRIAFGAGSRAWLFETGRRFDAAAIESALTAAFAVGAALPDRSKPLSNSVPGVIADALDVAGTRTRALYDQVVAEGYETREWLSGPLVDLMLAVTSVQRCLRLTGPAWDERQRARAAR